MKGAAVLAAVVVSAFPIASRAAEPGPPRSPEQRQQLVDLAHLLGEAHAFRQVCAGATDQTWRARMDRMLTIETPDKDFRSRLVSSFNAGFSAGQAEFPQCDTAATADAEQDAAARGAAIARRLAGRAP